MVTAQFSCYMAGATLNAAVLAQVYVHHETMHQFAVSLYSEPHVYERCMRVDRGRSRSKVPTKWFSKVSSADHDLLTRHSSALSKVSKHGA